MFGPATARPVVRPAVLVQLTVVSPAPLPVELLTTFVRATVLAVQASLRGSAAFETSLASVVKLVPPFVETFSDVGVVLSLIHI